MAVITMKPFTSFFMNLCGGETGAEASSLDWITDTVRIACLNALPNQDTAEFWSDISGTAVSGTNWAAAGQSLASKAILRDNSTNTGGLDAADVVVASVTISGVTHVAVYKDTGTASTSMLICFGTLDATSGSSGGTLTLAFNASGLLGGVAQA